MRYAISYVSTVAQHLSKVDFNELLERSTKYNNENDITGVLLSSETNFFQLIEGEEKRIKELFLKIEKDARHKNLITIIDKHVKKPAYDGFIYSMVTDNTKYNDSNLTSYLHQIEVLDPRAERAVKNVIEAFII